MRKSSAAYSNFKNRSREINLLLGLLHGVSDWRHDAAIIRSCLVLLCSHFEAYFEELISEYVDTLNTNGVYTSAVPSSIKAIQVSAEIEKIAEIKDWGKKVDKIDKLFKDKHVMWINKSSYKFGSKSIVSDFNNPGSKQIERLFKYVEMEPIFAQIGSFFKKDDIGDVFKHTINSFIAIRNRISHGEPSDCRQTKDDVLRYLNFLNTFALATDKLVGIKVKSIIKEKPWDTSLRNRKNYLKKLGLA